MMPDIPGRGSPRPETPLWPQHLMRRVKWSWQECVSQIVPPEHSNDDSGDVWSCQLVRVRLSTTVASWKGFLSPRLSVLLTIKLFHHREELLLPPPRPHSEGARTSTHSPPPSRNPVFTLGPQQFLQKNTARSPPA